jgi:hypothetical protein
VHTVRIAENKLIPLLNRPVHQTFSGPRSHHGGAVMLSATGFRPGIALDIRMNSEGEIQRPSGETDADGAYEWAGPTVQARADERPRADICHAGLGNVLLRCSCWRRWPGAGDATRNDHDHHWSSCSRRVLPPNRGSEAGEHREGLSYLKRFWKTRRSAGSTSEIAQ